jgi:acyl carrier protein
LIVEEKLDSEIRALFQRLFGIAPDKVHDGIRRGGLERWDSLGHLTLIEALRDVFKIDVQPEDALEIETVADLKRFVRERA